MDWIEKHQGANRYSGCILAVLCHLGGDDTRAGAYLNNCFEEGAVTSEERYRETYNRYRGSWLRRVWSGGWSEEKVADHAQGITKIYAEGAEGA